jgi:hypothetical protein
MAETSNKGVDSPISPKRRVDSPISPKRRVDSPISPKRSICDEAKSGETENSENDHQIVPLDVSKEIQKHILVQIQNIKNLLSNDNQELGKLQKIFIQMYVNANETFLGKLDCSLFLIQKQLDHEKKVQTDLKTENTDLLFASAGLEDSIRSLKLENASATFKIKRLEEENKSTQQTIKSLKDVNTKYEKELASSKTIVDENTKLRTMIDEMSAESKQMVGVSGGDNRFKCESNLVKQIVSTSITWYVEGDNSNDIACSGAYSKILETNFSSKKLQFDTMQIIGSGSHDYEIDLAKMTQTNKSTGKVRSLSRQMDKFDISFNHPDGFNEIAYAHIDQIRHLKFLPETNEEYKAVADNFYGTINSSHQIYMTDFEILSIRKAYNPHLANLYCVKRHMILKDMKGAAEDAGEAMLWHGSRRVESETIFRDGFQIRHANDGGYFGRGIYFAYHPSYSLDYAHRSKNSAGREILSMMYVKVNLGRQFIGPKDYRVNNPEQVHQGIDTICASVNREEDPIFAVYDNNQAYLGYIVSFAKK